MEAISKLKQVLAHPMFVPAVDKDSARALLEKAIQSYHRGKRLRRTQRQMSAIDRKLMQLDAERRNAKWPPANPGHAIATVSEIEAQAEPLRVEWRRLKDQRDRLLTVPS